MSLQRSKAKDKVSRHRGHGGPAEAPKRHGNRKIHTVKKATASQIRKTLRIPKHASETAQYALEDVLSGG
jgi:hypothetical protein